MAPVQFNGFSLDRDRRILSCSGRQVPLTRKAFELLMVLVDNAPRVVSKDELHRQLWPDTFVTDATVAGVVKELRRALGTQQASESLVRTAHGVGYAFTGTIQDRAVDDAGARYWLVSNSGRVKLNDGPNDIGRDPRAVVWLGSAEASRRHARITIAGANAILEDLGSKNRTLVNSAPVTGPTPLADGDTIQIGSAIFVLRVVDTAGTTQTASSALK